MSKESITIVFGTFAPMHKGHIDLIQRAKRENTKVVVVTSGYKDDRGDLIMTNHSGIPIYYIDGNYIDNYAKAIDIIDMIYKDI